MSGFNAFDLIRQALWLSLLLPAPILLVGLVVGLGISVLQAASQIHENTLVFVGKLAVSAAVLLLTGHWMLSTLVDFTRRLLLMIPHVVR